MWSRANDGPVLFLSILGQDASDLLSALTSFKFSKSLAKAAETTFVFRNDDRTLLSDPRTFPNQTWKFRFGLRDDLSPIITAVIRDVEPDYADKCSVTLKLYDSSLTLAGNSSGKNWGKIQSSDIAKKIATSRGLKAKVDPSKDVPQKAWVQPSDINDLQYLRDLAAAIDFELFVEGEFLIYRKKPYGSAPVRVITYYTDQTEQSFVKSCKPKIKGLGPVKSGAASTDKKDSTKTGDKSNTALSGYKQSLEGEHGDDAGLSYEPAVPADGVTQKAPTGANASGMAHANRQQMLDQCNEMSSDHIFTPSLWPGQSYTWAGLDAQLNGKWYADKLDCDMSGTALTTKVDWKRNSKNKSTTDGKDKNKNANNKDADGKGAPLVGHLLDILDGEGAPDEEGEE